MRKLTPWSERPATWLGRRLLLTTRLVSAHAGKDNVLLSDEVSGQDEATAQQ